MLFLRSPRDGVQVWTSPIRARRASSARSLLVDRRRTGCGPALRLRGPVPWLVAIGGGDDMLQRCP
ncbi:MAG: hypothetical protein R3F34_10510 [Planctomycetota bacterium]